MSVRVRPCEERDLAATADLFNELIPTTTVAWTDVLTSVEERAAALADHRNDGFPSSRNPSPPSFTLAYSTV